MTSAKSSSTFYVFELHNLDNLYCCGWVPCFLVSRPFRSRDEFLLLYGVTRCISWSDSHEVTTFLTLDNVYILCFYGLLGLVRRIYTLGCTDRLFRPNKRQFTSGLHLTCTFQ